MNRKKLLKFSLASVLTLSATAYFTDGSQASEMEIDKETEENHEVQVNENSNGWGDESGIVIDEELSEEEDSVVPYSENEAPNTFNTDGYANATDDWEDGNQEVEDGDLEEEDFEVDYGDWDPNAAYDEFGNLLYTAEEVNHYENVLNNALQTPNSYVYVADGVYEYYYDVNEEGYAINERMGERAIPADLIHRKYEIFSNEKLYQLGVDIPPTAPEGPEVEDPGDDEVVEPIPEPQDPDVEEGGDDETEPEPEPEPEEPPVDEGDTEDEETEEPPVDEDEYEETEEPPVDEDEGEETEEPPVVEDEGEETEEPPVVEDEGEETEEPPVDEDEGEETEEPPVVEDDLSPNYLNEITLIDSESGNEIRTVSFVGSTFDNRLSNLLENINENYGTEYIVENQIFVGRSINSSTINGVTQTRTTDSYEIYLSNDSDTEYPFDEQVFIPDHTLYDDVHADTTLKDITITDTEGVIVYSGSTQAAVTVDEFIRQSMGNIDSDIYFYESVSVTSGVTTRITNEGFYSGEFQDINVIVDFVAMEDEELPSEGDENDAEEPPSEDDVDDAEGPPAEGDENDAEEPPSEGDLDDSEEPPSESDEDDAETPPTEGDEDGAETPPTEGDEDDAETPPTEGDEGDAETPPTEGDEDDAEEPPSESDEDDAETPPSEGDEGDAETPPTESDEGDAETPPTESDEDGAETPPTEGDEDDAETPPTEGDEGDAETPPTEGDEGDAETPPTEGDEDDAEEPPAEDDGEIEDMGESSGDDETSEPIESEGNVIEQEDIDKNKTYSNASIESSADENIGSESDDSAETVKTDSTEEDFVKSSDEITDNDDSENEVTSDTLPDTGIAEQRTTLLATVLAALGLGFLVRKRKKTEK